MARQKTSLEISSQQAAMLTWIHDFSPDGVITTDRDFQVQSWNRWMELRSGKDVLAVAGVSLFDLFPDLQSRGLKARFERALNGEISVLSTALHGYLLPLPPYIRDSGFAHMQQ